MEVEKKIRQEAIRLYLQGISVGMISKELERSRQWVYKWINRYIQNPTGTWYMEASTAPHHIFGKSSPTIEAAIISIRKKLQSHQYHQTGAVNILYHLADLGISPPSISTINRIIKRHGLNRNDPIKKKKNTEYPTYFVNVQQMDLVGPRYLKGGIRFYLFDIIDVDTHFGFTYPIRDKSAQSIAPCLIDFWSRFQLPDFLQMDNELSFRGSNKYPRSLGLLMRLTLSNGISPIFIPPSEPWRNGVIERFNRLVQQKFLSTQTFFTFEEMKRKAEEFSLFHNHYHRYSTSGQKTPDQFLPMINRNFSLQKKIDIKAPIPVEEGILIFIRFIRSNLKLKILDSVFEVNHELKYNYVTVRIILEKYILVVSRNEYVYHIFPFPMSL
ncbi:MAG: helix-turn-helix domain-containing protein [Bacteroidales bacterium]|nr:helix-turn-helix domain-containing protein [Bacteroidales bacterium]